MRKGTSIFVKCYPTGAVVVYGKTEKGEDLEIHLRYQDTEKLRQVFALERKLRFDPDALGHMQWHVERGELAPVEGCSSCEYIRKEQKERRARRKIEARIKEIVNQKADERGEAERRLDQMNEPQV